MKHRLLIHSLAVGLGLCALPSLTLYSSEESVKSPREGILPPAPSEVIFTSAYTNAVQQAFFPVFTARYFQSEIPFLVAADDNLPFPFAYALSSFSDFSYNTTERVLIFNSPGIYFITYQLRCSSAGGSSLAMEISLDNVNWGPQASGAISLPGAAVTDLTISNAIILSFDAAPFYIRVRVVDVDITIQNAPSLTVPGGAACQIEIFSLFVADKANS